ncbi:exocyst complex component Sec5-domain-containing protein [Plectosphaerella plurivora]|uniref:Exocyst complex component SEC5 n=1 Tax=Plectosphaerella plurivora TaxID=936078 RepID=A0A9P9ADB2_9PEZI|nr:exocyst complex component Sec5-domain-containing protein [Plectosphaerella plurivora]
MGDYQRTVLEFYGLPNPYPTEWPAEKNVSDGSDDELDKKTTKLARRKSKYQALERAASDRRSTIPGSQSEKGGVGNIVQKDEPDPLGTTDSVVRTLRQLGLPVQDDTRLRNRFLLSSTTFTPALFLSQMHPTADTRDLLAGLDVLSQSIDQKSASLKVLVESNFERFVKAKATIDNVYKEMKYRGTEPPSSASQHRRNHSRHASRTSFRNSASGGLPLGGSLASPPPDTRKKNAIVKESEYGVSGIKTPLLEVSAKAEEVWGPAIGGREKEEALRTVSAFLNRFNDYIELGSSVADSIKRRDFETLVEDYNKARRFADDTRRMAESIGSGKANDAQLYQLLVASRMWQDVDEHIQLFKRDNFRRLVSLHGVSKTEHLGGQPQDQHMELISLLLELGVEDNPIWLWLASRYEYLKGKIQQTGDRTKVEIEVLRRRLANGEQPAPHLLSSHLRGLGRQSVENRISTVDTPDIIELWEKIVQFLSALLSAQGILGEVVDFWNTVEGFIEGKTQRTLPTGYNGESRQHHMLSDQAITDLRKGVVELADMIRETIYLFFAGLPPEDISLLFSPLPTTPNTPKSAGLPGSLTPTAMRDPRFVLDINNIPPPSPKRGEAWEKFAFWPPHSNSVSGVHYLAKMLALVGSGAADLAGLAPIKVASDGGVVDGLRTLVGAARERCVTAICAAWNKDAENIKYVEDWYRSPDAGDVTRMPSTFAAFEGALLAGMQKILYISEAMSKPGAGDIVLAPPSKLLQMVRSQYVTTLYKALSGMVENAERSVKKADDDWTTDMEGSIATTAPPPAKGARGALDARDRNVRMLVTLSNLQALRSQVVPNLNTQFENAFSVKLTDESKTIRDVLGQIDARLFQSYTKPFIDSLRAIVRKGITAEGWAPPAGEKPREARPYVYETLLCLVLVHTQVSTTAASLTSQVLSYLLEQTSRELLEAFRTRERYTLGGLMQATLDVEFVAQTLSQYTTDKASQLQSEIYQELDSRTDNDARARLQSELPDMRSVLKRLREASKNEFACFKKLKRPGPGGGGGPERRDTGASASSVGTGKG